MAKDIFVNDRKKKISRLPLKGTFRAWFIAFASHVPRYKRDQLLEHILHLEHLEITPCLVFISSLKTSELQMP